MLQSHILGFPRIGKNRETKRHIEQYWRGDLPLEDLLEYEKKAAMELIDLQKQAGLSIITLGAFHLYDHVLDLTGHFSALPQRFADIENLTDRKFATARGFEEEPASDMSKWFNTNYHYIVPEWGPDTTFKLDCDAYLESIREQAEASQGLQTKVVLVGPITFLALGSETSADVYKKDLLQPLLNCYAQLITKIAELGVDWIQLDEPILVTDTEISLQEEAVLAYKKLTGLGAKLMLATYFHEVASRINRVPSNSIDALHIDTIASSDQIDQLFATLPKGVALSLGIVDGRSVWRTDIDKVSSHIQTWRANAEERELMIGSSCSLLHSPWSVESEDDLEPKLRGALSFACEKLDEIVVLTWDANRHKKRWVESFKIAGETARGNLEEYRQQFAGAKKTARPKEHRSPEPHQRAGQQRIDLKLPQFPTTTIGSLPQTSDIRKTRAAFKNGKISKKDYDKEMHKHIDECVKMQEKVGLDVLVHGEPERNDMVEYFGELLDGVAVTENGWVQSYGSRCVKPPIIHSDVSRPQAMTVDWITYAQGRTKKPMKGMLTGPVTILAWSFCRNDMTREAITKQIALAIRDEVQDLEASGIRIIQVDEPALRELLPLRKDEWAGYLRWATQAFRIATSQVDQKTQVHTHMCYSEFEDILDGIIDLEADVITIEQARSQMGLLAPLHQANYKADVGPGVYDVHSPTVPSVEEIEALLTKAAEQLSPGQLWVNPDCGLKTRAWKEVKPALENMVQAAHNLRDNEEYAVD